MEQELWNGTYYLKFSEGKRKALGQRDGLPIRWKMGFTFSWVGSWYFQPDRVETTLSTIRRINIALTPQVGAANFAEARRTALRGQVQNRGVRPARDVPAESWFCR